MSLGDFVFWSWLCSLPGLALVVLLLHTALRVVEGSAVPTPTLLLVAAILAVKVGLVTWAARQAREA